MEKKMEIEDLINNVSDQDFAKAGVTFADIMNNKIQDSLEQEKVAVARAVYDEDESEEDAEYIDDGEEDPDDEDIEAAIDELDMDDVEGVPV
jgi:hypothetical protein